MERFAGRYALVRPLGQGGMGRVWLAQDLTSGEECALKRVELRLPRAERDSLQREFEVLARVRHPAVVSVYELGFAPDGTPFYTMEYVPGRPADQALGGADWPAFLELAARITEAVEGLHAAGVVHGDLKPSNLLVLPTGGDGAAGGVRLLDFGLAALLERERQGHRGTAGYAAPEVVGGKPLSVASDLYSLGATLHVLALAVAGGAGAKPARAPQDAAAARLALEEARVPEALSRLVVRLLAASPEARPASARDVWLELVRLAPAARRSLAERLESGAIVGRGRELARLERWFAQARHDVGLVWLSGDSGMGKSTLLRELAVRASLAGRAVISLVGSEGVREGSVARTLLLRLAVAAGAPGAEHAEEAALRARLERAEALRESDLSALTTAALAWGRRVRERSGPALVTLDDHERVDDLSRALVRRVVSSGGDQPIRFVAASAAVEPPAEEGLLVEAEMAEALPLGSLDRAASDALIASRLRSAPPVGLADVLWTRCGGHPGLTAEVLRVAARSGALHETEQGAIALDREALERLSLPDGFEAACLGRLAAMPPPAVAAATALAVWGAPVAPADVLAIEPAVDLGSLAALRGAGLLATHEDGRVTLNPPALARALLERLAPEERARFHRRALERPGLPPEQRFRLWRGAGEPARALEEAERALASAPDARLAAEAADLARESLPGEPAAAWEARAGELLLDRGRYREARPRLERAVALAPDAADAARRRFLLSGACLRTGAFEELRALLEPALEGDLPDGMRARMLMNLSGGYLASGDVERGLALTEAALPVAEAAGDPEALGLVLVGLVYLRLRTPRPGESARELAERALEAYTRAGLPTGRLRAAGVLASALGQEQRHAEAEQVLRDALAEARERDLRLPLAELLHGLVVLLAETGRWREWREAEREALRLAIEEGWPGAAAQARLGLLMSDVFTGEGRRTLADARSCLRLVRRHQRVLEGSAWRVAGMALRNTGRHRAAERVLRRALQVGERSGFLLEIQWQHVEYGALLARMGRWPEAREVWQSLWAEHPEPDSVPTCVLCLDLGRAALRSQDVDTAEQRLAAASAWLDRHPALYADALRHQLRAELLLVRGQAGSAASEVTRTLDAYGALPAPADRGWAALEFARLANRTGVSARLPLGDWLALAAADFETVGDRRGRERALALAVDWHRRYSSGTAAPARDRDLLQAVGRLLDSMPDLAQLTRAAMRLAVEELDAERGVLLLARKGGATGEGEDDLRPVVEHGAIDAETRREALSYSRDVVQRVRRSGGAFLTPDARVEGESLSHSVMTLGLRSILCVPLFVRSRVVGAVYLDDSRRPEMFGEAERALLEGFAHLLAVAIENSRGHEQVVRENEQLVDENLSLRKEAGRRFHPRNLVGGSLAMQRVLAIVERAAATTSSVMLTGEYGTGKELIARMLHHSGPRALGPFVAVNCGAIAPTLLESELFGILADVATGVKARAGRFVEADGGTLFLDEIGDMPVQQQVALLRVLSENAVTPVGGGRPIPVDVRVIAATNRDMPRAIAEGAFREDLWYRLNVIPIEMPPLRERKADIPALAHHFAKVFAAQQEREVPTLSSGLLAVLMQSDWPGNVRELQNYIERLMAMTPGKVLHPDPLPHDLQQRLASASRAERGRSLEELVADLEKRHVLAALDRHAGNQSRAARELGLTEQSLRYRLRKYSLGRARHFPRTR